LVLRHALFSNLFPVWSEISARVAGYLKKHVAVVEGLEVVCRVSCIQEVFHYMVVVLS